MGEKASNFLHYFEKMFTRVGKFTQKNALATICIPAYMWLMIFLKSHVFTLHFLMIYGPDALISIQDTKEEGTDVDKAWKHY